MAKNPLIVMLFHNRIETTGQALEALWDSLEQGDEFDFVLIDNGSTARASAAETVMEWGKRFVDRQAGRVQVYVLQKNVGIPAALNIAMGFRLPGQDLIKLDNDCAIETRGWLSIVPDAFRVWEINGINRMTVIAGPWFPRYYKAKGVRHLGRIRDGIEWVRPVFHQCAWHRGSFLDTMGYFDRLADWHMYGYGDHMIAHKARLLDFMTVRVKGWQAKNLQKQSTLGTKERRAHVDAVRPLFRDRVNYWESTGDLYTNADGYPAGMDRRQK